MKLIQVLGPGCPRCETLYQNVQQAVEEASIPAQVEKITDLKRIALMGVIQTPGLVVNGQVISQGKVLSVEEIKKLLS
ncbi:redox-active disulfide protein 2 [Thermodesulfatator indicus DSM 15286]|uniref:Redox-active disulfide protein 2 n=1 Tax=Thermodesulfatator indicus (strain DSM 15286 / JCM 11887 / CIR29812) TaxID=667014 RepID=F8AA09_THEID|nr:thioredoxin family protein [Thermodesulfatator indicus]AEH45295.1 redox-active disulfide protein 2 [Thermodesulfatator indicus DSM 15286]